MDSRPEAILKEYYLSVLPEDSTADIACSEHAKMYAIRGAESCIAKRDVEDLGVSIRFTPTNYAKYRLQIRVDSSGPQSIRLPARSDQSMAQIRALFGESGTPSVMTLAANRAHKCPPSYATTVAATAAVNSVNSKDKRGEAHIHYEDI